MSPSSHCPETGASTGITLNLSAEVIAKSGLGIIKAMACEMAEHTLPGAESTPPDHRLQQLRTLAHGLVSLLILFDQAGIRLHVPANALLTGNEVEAGLGDGGTVK